ncbi:hypothetical protein [Rhodococcus sp. HNM0569]|uniref:TY-Chap domain-containing protein n=1 Tax=Rhodococcus sp. HNM0569 TaxID=2716340 RepID=UPI00146E996D|nr:hypothetical protein [Rhodococcus sp. HNM0569]NLU84361.1 hypothetical protein [Rhodococcus sp. HNM0569]
MHATPSDFDGSVRRAWVEFRGSLADILETLAEGEIVMLEAAWDESPSSRGVQFLSWGGGLVRCEVPSNAFLGADEQLDDADESWLESLGLSRPTCARSGDHGDGSPAFWRDDPRAFADRLADIAVRVLRDLWAVPHPAFIRVSGCPAAQQLEPTPPAEPTDDSWLPVFPENPDELRSLLVHTLSCTLQLPVRLDGDRDPVVELSGTRVHVWPTDDEPAVRIMAAVVRDLSDHADALALADSLSRQWRYFHAEVMGSNLVAQYTLPAAPFVPGQLAEVLAALSAIIDSTRLSPDQLGEHLRDAPLVPDDDVDEHATEFDVIEYNSAEENDDLPAPLVQLAELDPDATGFTDSETVFEVCGRDPDILRFYLGVAVDQQQAWDDSADDAECLDDHTERDESRHEADGWAATARVLRRALAVLTNHPSARSIRPPQLELFALPSDPTLFSFIMREDATDTDDR